MRRGALSLLAPALLLAACAAPPPSPVYTGWFKELNGCREEYAALDARVDAAGVRDAGYYRVPGFPYLRTDRTLASFKDEVEGVNQIGGWIRQMREFDQEAREFEYLNLGMSMQEIGLQRFRFLGCGRGLAALELDDPAAFARLKAAVTPPDEYSGVARAFGLYPLALPLLQARVHARQDRVREAFAAPLAPAAAPARLVLWSVSQVENRALVAKGFETALADELGFPGLVDSEWRALAEIHAPQLWIETAGASDRPGAPRLKGGGAGVDPEQPLVNYQINFARFGTAPVVEITYFIWFPGATDGAGIDGMLWRVTLDGHAQPLVYESLHASGRDHLWFPVQPLVRRGGNSAWEESPLIPQAQAPASLPTLRLAAGTHAVRRVVAPEAVPAGEAHTYELRRYEDLFTLPRPEGGTRSLFGPDGRIPGTAGARDFGWCWSCGIPQPRALRQYGHHPIVTVGRRQLDDAFLLDTVFVPPAVVPLGPPASTTTAAPAADTAVPPG